MKTNRETAPRPSSGIGARIYCARTVAGLSLLGLAKKAGVAYSCLWRVELHNHIPRHSVIERLAKALDVSPCWLAYGVLSEEENHAEITD